MICPHCGGDCESEDVGVGFTEAWGIVKNDIDIRWFCNECGSEITPSPVDFDTWGD